MSHKKMISVFVLASLSACGIKINEHENDRPVASENAPEIKQKSDDILLIEEQESPNPEAAGPVLEGNTPNQKSTNKPVVLPTAVAAATVIPETNVPNANGTWNSECVKSEYLGSDSLVLKFEENRLSVIANHFSDEKCTKIADIFRFKKTFVVEIFPGRLPTLRLELKDVYKTNYVLKNDPGHKLGQEFLRTEFPSDSRAPGSFTRGREEFTCIQINGNLLSIADGGKAKVKFTNNFVELASQGITLLKKSP